MQCSSQANILSAKFERKKKDSHCYCDCVNIVQMDGRQNEEREAERGGNLNRLLK